MQIWIVVGVAGLLWGAAALRYFFGVDILNRRGNSPTSVEFYTWSAALGSVASITWGFLSTRRMLFLAEYGIETTGVVTSISPLGSKGLRPVRYSYRSGPLTYTGAADILQSEAGELEAGSPLRLFVDPRHPRKSRPFDDVLPSRFAAEVRPLDAATPSGAVPSAERWRQTP